MFTFKMVIVEDAPHLKKHLKLAKVFYEGHWLGWVYLERNKKLWGYMLWEGDSTAIFANREAAADALLFRYREEHAK